MTCKDALDLNAKLIATEQKEYHESLKSGFMEIAERLSILLGEKVSENCLFLYCGGKFKGSFY